MILYPPGKRPNPFLPKEYPSIPPDVREEMKARVKKIVVAPMGYSEIYHHLKAEGYNYTIHAIYAVINEVDTEWSRL